MSPENTTQRLLFTLSYVGTDFCGFQLQENGRTVQGELEAAFARLAGVFVRVHGAGRTDSGVHAEGQVAHADIPWARRGLNWRRALNAVLPPDVAVRDVRLVESDWHARFDAVAKSYAYRLWLDREFVPPALKPFVWACGPLNVDAMREAAWHLMGRHDFRSFQNQGTPLEDTVRTLHKVSVRPGDSALEASEGHRTLFGGEQDERPWPELIWEFTADGFLKQMVRNLMGLLVAVGWGKITTEAVPDILAARNRAGYIPTAPAHGLTLLRVYYPGSRGKV